MIASRAHSASDTCCQRCGRTGVHVRPRAVLCVISWFIASESWAVREVWCRRCFARWALAYTALTVLLGPWHLPDGLVNTCRAVYWNLLRRDYEKRESTLGVRVWNQKLKWTPFGQFFVTGKYGVLVLLLQQGVLVWQLSSYFSLLVDFSAMTVLSLAVALAAGAGLGTAYIVVQKKRSGEFFSGHELEHIILFELGGILSVGLAEASANTATPTNPLGFGMFFIGGAVPAIIVLTWIAFVTTSVTCECLDESCYAPLKLSRAQYAFASEGENRFVVAPGHEDPRRDIVVGRTRGYVVVESAF